MIGEQSRKDLKNLIDFLRENGVVHFKQGDLELVLIDKPVAPPPEEKPATNPLATPPKRGADGLTAEQQEELYGSPIDAEK